MTLNMEDSEDDLEEAEVESDDEIRPSIKKKGKTKSKRRVKQVKSKIPLAVARNHIDDDGIETVNLDNLVPVISELQTSIRIMMTGNVPDHFKVI